MDLGNSAHFNAARRFIEDDQLVFQLRKRVFEANGPIERERARIVAFFEFLEDAPHLFKILSEGPVHAPEGFHRHLAQQTESYRRAMLYELKQGNLKIDDPNELEVITRMLLSAHEYLSARFCFVDGHFTGAPDFVVDAYMKVAESVLFKGLEDRRET